MSNYLPIEKRKQIFHLLVEGNGKRSVMRIVGCSGAAITELQRRLCSIIEYFNRRYLKELEITNIEADEIKTFVYKKNNVKWVYVALDRKSKMVINFHIGKRDTENATIFLKELSDRLISKCELGTDCLQAYVTAIQNTQKGYVMDDTHWIILMRARSMGNVLGRGISNRIETHNGNIRQHVSRLSRRTRCFSKKIEGLRQHLTLFFFYYNYIKRHQSLKCAPLVKAGIINSSFTIDTLFEYDEMFTGKMSNLNSKKTYGKVEPKSNNRNDADDFIKDMANVGTIKLGTNRSKYYAKVIKIA